LKFNLTKLRETYGEKQKIQSPFSLLTTSWLVLVGVAVVLWGMGN
jgi:hypothetical protein